MVKLIHKELSREVLDAAFAVHRIAGPGFLEHVYEESMCIELRLRSITFERQKVYPFTFKGFDAGGYIADLVIEGKIILELKAVKCLTSIMTAQLINYLKVSGLKAGYLFNFNSVCFEWKRYVLERGCLPVS